MYRGFSDMVEGWTKNLALLFPHALTLAAWRLLDMLLLLLPVLLLPLPYLVLWQRLAILLLWLRTLLRFYRRVRAVELSVLDCAAVGAWRCRCLSCLLVRSWMRHKVFHQVAWKGREYRTCELG